MWGSKYFLTVMRNTFVNCAVSRMARCRVMSKVEFFQDDPDDHLGFPNCV